MKKAVLLLLLLLAVLFIPLNTNAQIKDVTSNNQLIGKVTTLGKLAAELYKVENRDSYFMIYQDVKFTTLTSVKDFVIGDKKTVIQFKNIMLDMIKNKTKNKTIELEGSTFYFIKKSSTIETHITSKSGVSSVMRWLNKKQINRLFPAEKLK